jgi:transglutaminase-like putative cysteine protease
MPTFMLSLNWNDQGIRAFKEAPNNGNKLRLLSAGPGVLGMKLTGLVNNSGALDDYDPNAQVVPVQDLPLDALPYLRSSRYCETDLLSDLAWGAFGSIAGGYGKVRAVCDFVHTRLRFSYPEARPTRTAAEAMPNFYTIFSKFSFFQGVTAARGNRGKFPGQLSLVRGG